MGLNANVRLSRARSALALASGLGSHYSPAWRGANSADFCRPWPFFFRGGRGRLPVAVQMR